MGIRFYCPNGHRLHVKSFLAGKRGICPHCQARFRIPEESEIPRGAPKTKPHEGDAGWSARGATGTASVAVVSSVDGFPVTVGSLRSPSPSPAPIGELHSDPIDEAPEAVWYVRPPSGGQYGPAKGDVMRRWIEEGRVSADSLVWREGWADWQPAGPVFPALGSSYTSPVPGPLNREPVALQLQSGAAESTLAGRSPSATGRPDSKAKSIAAIVVLVLVVVVLISVLVYVLTTKS